MTMVCEQLTKEKIKVDGVIMDPPRSGSTPAFLNSLKVLFFYCISHFYY